MKTADMLDHKELGSILEGLEGRGYKAYKKIKGSYRFPSFALIIDHVQGDPFASPSRLRVKVPQSIAGFPSELYKSDSREKALRDYLTRSFYREARKYSSNRGTGKSGLITINQPNQEIIQRTSAYINDEEVEIRFVVGLPARGRRILGRQAAALLCQDIPTIVQKSLFYSSLDPGAIRRHVRTAEDADWLRSRLSKLGLVAFVADGARLPRRSGVDARPMEENVVPFRSPDPLRVEFELPNQGRVSGMGVPTGVTLIVGGGYHGKSTLLRALELGVYDHIPGDGRELVVTVADAAKIRAEDGRSIVGVDISPFISDLPQGRSTRSFSTPDASGSTSQAANIMEALEAGSSLLLLDEDTSATNFMIRDHRMQELVSKDKEPITPFIDKVRELYNELGVSTVLVMGGSGDYFEVADTVIAMDEFLPGEVTAQAKEIASRLVTGREPEAGKGFGSITPRIPRAESIDPSRGRRAVKTRVRQTEEITFGTEDIDLSSVQQLVEPGQLSALTAAIIYAKHRYMNDKLAIPAILAKVMEDVAEKGLDILTPFPQGDLVMFRSLELAAALNRLRTLSVR